MALELHIYNGSCVKYNWNLPAEIKFKIKIGVK